MMMLMEHSNVGLYVFMGVLCSLSFSVILWRTGQMRKALGYPVLLDVSALVILVLTLHSTILGTLIAIVAALVFSLTIGALRLVCGWQRYIRCADGKRRWIDQRLPLHCLIRHTPGFAHFAKWAA